MTVQQPPASRLSWLEEQQPRALARRLVAQGTHEQSTADTVEAVVEECAAIWHAAPTQVAAVAAIYDPAHPDQAWLRQQSLLTAATLINWPLWTSDQPSSAGSRDRRRLGAIQLGTVRCVARTVPARLVVIALADRGATCAQQAKLATGHFRRNGQRFDVSLRASDRGTVDRVVTLPAWATQATEAHLDDCYRYRRLRPCYSGHADTIGERGKAVAARIDRVLAAADIHATAASLRLTAGLQALEAGGPVAAMRRLGSNSIPATLAYLNG